MVVDPVKLFAFIIVIIMFVMNIFEYALIVDDEEKHEAIPGILIVANFIASVIIAADMFFE